MSLRYCLILAILSALPAGLPADDVPGLKPGEKAGDLWEKNTLGMKFRWCPPGKFVMGSSNVEIDAMLQTDPTLQLASKEDFDDEAQVNVTLTRGFWLGQYEVTQAEWVAIMGTTPWKGEEYSKEGDTHPAMNVTWDEARYFCGSLTAKGHNEGWLPQDWKFDLPTEAQWEYACRAGTTTSFSFGDDHSQLGQYAWFQKNAFYIRESYAHQVGQKKPNPWNLFDTHGNVTEWCRDGYRIQLQKLPGGIDPEVPVTMQSDHRITRGGGWGSFSRNCRSGAREWRTTAQTFTNQGVRLALVRSGK